MIPTALSILGWLLAVAPEPALRALCAAGGELILWLAPRRRRLLRSNLDHAFPDRPRAWRRRIARESSRRLVETAMLSLAAPFLSERRIRRIARLGASTEAFAREISARPRPVVLATLHLALWESQTWLKALSPVPLPEFGIIFRPLDRASADAFVKRTRERHGMRLLSRREGFAEALEILRGKGCVGVLFDQNAGMQGALTLLLGRVCSTTELPGLLAAKFGAELRTFYPRRTAFWRVTFETDPVANDGTVSGATLSLNRWFEAAMSDEGLCASWLWAHDRWRNQDIPAVRLRLEAKRDLLPADLRSRGLSRPPRGTRFWMRLPNWLGDVAMAVPLLRAVRESRPDAEITLLARPGFVPLLESLGVADRILALPGRGPGYFARFARLRASYPDVWILFTNSVRGDLEARIAGSPQRFGILRPGRHRPLLTHAYRPPEGFDEAHHHQLELWDNFLRHFGLDAPLDCSPLSPAAPWARPAGPAADAAGARPRPIGLIAGSENDPSKRWPVGHWRRLVEAFPADRFILFGTPGDAAVASEVSAGFDRDRVANLAGETSLAEFAAALLGCRLLVANDTGGMHLANALGVPLIALFGPTNPIRTGPVYASPYRILQPPGCPPAGGGPLGDLAPEAVIAAVGDLPWRR
ncbi:MAG TPA: glycosyltransferase family 9 protein [Opitutaceae bacterium]|nr:glycosyltransferase family 9 protein [Opitutaceae bacterium]